MSDVPYVYRYNLPPDALELFRAEYQQALQQEDARRDRDVYARRRALDAVKERFEKDRSTGVWRLREK